MVRCMLLRAALVIGALLAIGLLPVPVAPVVAADGCWRGTVISGEAHFTLTLVDAQGRSLGITNRDIGQVNHPDLPAPARLGIRIQHSGVDQVGCPVCGREALL